MHWRPSVEPLLIMDSKRTTISSGAYFILALMLLLAPLRWVIATLLAAVIHELGHYGAVLLCKGQVRNVKMGIFHSEMEITALTDWQELFCIIAGPLFGGLLLFLSPWMPLVAVCAWIQTLYNILPIYPLDGGRLLRCMARMLHVNNNRVRAIEGVAIVLLAVLLIVLGLSLGRSAFLLGCVLLSKAFSGKIPCKHRQYWI